MWRDDQQGDGEGYQSEHALLYAGLAAHLPLPASHTLPTPINTVVNIAEVSHRLSQCFLGFGQSSRRTPVSVCYALSGVTKNTPLNMIYYAGGTKRFFHSVTERVSRQPW